MSLPRAILLFGTTLAALFAAPSHAQQFRKTDKGQILFVSSSGELKSDASLLFDEKTRSVKIDRLIANTFDGDGIDFNGHEIRNAHVIDSSIDGVKHLSVESLAISGQSSSRKGLQQQGHYGLAVIDTDGIVDSTRHLRWDDDTRTLLVPSFSSFSKIGLEIKTDVDFMAHQLKNFTIEANTTLSSLVIKDGIIDNAILTNCTATGLSLSDVTLDSLSVTKFDTVANVGSLVLVGEGGAIDVSPNLKQDKDGTILIDGKVVITKSLDLSGQDMMNANFRSGTIDGSIDVNVDHIKAREIVLTDIQEDKTITSDTIAMLGLDGKLTLGPVSIDKSGRIGDIRMNGNIDFEQSNNNESRGKIKNAAIVGGSIDELERLTVVGDTELKAGLTVTGVTYMDGSLTVSGSVLGSGPYVDISDIRFKRNIVPMESVDILDRILCLEGVSYELDKTKDNLQGRLRRAVANNEDVHGRQYGFIAQEVEKIFPELVYTDDYDFKGLHYSRFAPLFAEGLKQLTEEVRELQAWKVQVMKEMEDIKKYHGSCSESDHDDVINATTTTMVESSAA